MEPDRPTDDGVRAADEQPLTTRWSRRRFLAGSGVAAVGLLGGLGGACSDSDGGSASQDAPAVDLHLRCAGQARRCRDRGG